MKNITLLLLLSSTLCFAQVGIGTTNPNASLDIRSSNEATPSNTDGLLIPKVEEFPVINPTALQDGMLVYATGTGSVTKGFYNWEFATTSWVAIGGVGSTIDKIDDLIDGKSDNDGTQDGSSIFFGIDAGLNDDTTDNKNVGIGYQSLMTNTSGFNNTASGYASLFSNSTGYSNTANGIASLYANSTGFNNTANGESSLISNTTGHNNTASGRSSLRSISIGNNNTAYGSYSGDDVQGDNNLFLGYGAGDGSVTRSLNGSVMVGYQAGFDETNSNRLFIENSNADSDNALIYGEFDNDILRTNGTFQIGNPTGTGYALPTVDGSVNQVMQTDGAGAMTWVDPSATVIHNINDLVDGKSDNDGTDDGSSIFLGLDSGGFDDGTDNQNVGIGYQSLYSNTSGDNNTAIGYQSLYSNSTGVWNTANGRHSLYSNTSGWFNTANGFNSLAANTTGSRNIANGGSSMYYNTIGSENTASGNSSLFSNTTGDHNTANGFQSLFENTTGNYNIAIGSYSGRNVEGSDNVFIGYQAGAGNAVHSKSGSVMIGYQAGYIETNSNRLYIENSNSSTPLIYGEFDNDILGINGSLGVGTQAPGAPFHVENEGVSGVQNIVAALVSNTSNRPVLQFSETANVGLAEGMSIEYDGRGSGDANRIVINNIGGSPLYEFRNGGDLTLVDGDLIVRGTATDREIKLEDDAGNADRVLMRQTSTQDIYVGDIDDNGGDTYVRAGGNTELSVIAGTGFVGVNTTTPAYTFEVIGNAAKPGGGSWINSSDMRLKKNIHPYKKGLEIIQKIEPVSYQYNQLSGFNENTTYVGVIAQELQKVAPTMVTSYTRENQEYLAVDNSEMTYLLINAIKAQQKEIESLKQELATLKNLILSSNNE